MDMNKSITQIKDYGRVKLRLDAVMAEKGVNRNQLARAIQTNYAVASKWHDGEVEKLDLDILARICYVLECSVADLLYYEEK